MFKYPYTIPLLLEASVILVRGAAGGPGSILKNLGGGYNVLKLLLFEYCLYCELVTAVATHSEQSYMHTYDLVD